MVDTVTPPKKLPTSHYASKGAFPIIDQSQSDICGWTDDHEALIIDSLPLIIFGDHTCILKLIDRPFAQGADGIKILKSRPKVGTPYLYQFLIYQPVVTEEYKRHYSILKEKLVSFPDHKTGEQQKIAECLSSVDELIAAQARKLDALKTHKKGLMQQLFPREGENQPRLRFPEFQNDGEWVEKLLQELFVFKQGLQVPVEKQFTASNGRMVRFIRIIDVTQSNEPERYIEDPGKEYLVEKNSLFMIRYGTPGVVSIGFEGVIANNLFRIIPKSNIQISAKFFFYLFKNMQEYLQSLSGSSSMPAINFSTLNNLSVTFPAAPEQQRIANCLTTLDDLIAAQTQKLAALKTHKKALMQQLFPSAEEVEA